MIIKIHDINDLVYLLHPCEYVYLSVDLSIQEIMHYNNGRMIENMAKRNLESEATLRGLRIMEWWGGEIGKMDPLAYTYRIMAKCHNPDKWDR